MLCLEGRVFACCDPEDPCKLTAVLEKQAGERVGLEQYTQQLENPSPLSSFFNFRTALVPHATS